MSLILSPAPHVRTKNTTQRLMLNVVISLLPCAAAGIYYFGLRAAIVLAVSVVSAVLAELVWQKLAHQTVRINDFSAVVTGLLIRRFGRGIPALVLSMVAGLAFCYLFGTVWFCTVYSTGKTFGAALMLCVVPYLLPEVVKIALAMLVIRRVGPHLRLN